MEDKLKDELDDIMEELFKHTHEAECKYPHRDKTLDGLPRVMIALLIKWYSDKDDGLLTESDMFELNGAIRMMGYFTEYINNEENKLRSFKLS